MNFLYPSILVFLIAIFNTAQAQIGIGQTAGQVEINDAPGGQVKVIESEKNLKYKGSPYLAKDWHPLVIYFKSGLEYEVSEGNFNVQSKMIEVKIGAEIHQYSSYLVKGFKFLDSEAYYPSVETFAPSMQLGRSGFVRLLVDGATQLLTKYSIGIKKGYYVPALDAGDKRDELFLIEEYFMQRQKEVVLLPKSEKKILSLFSKEVATKLKAHIKEEKLNIKKEEDIIRLFEYIVTKGI